MIEDPLGPLTALAVNDRGDRVLAASWDGTVSVWNARSGALDRRFAWGGATARITVAPSGRKPAR